MSPSNPGKSVIFWILLDFKCFTDFKALKDFLRVLEEVGDLGDLGDEFGRVITVLGVLWSFSRIKLERGISSTWGFSHKFNFNFGDFWGQIGRGISLTWGFLDVDNLNFGDLRLNLDLSFLEYSTSILTSLSFWGFVGTLSQVNGDFLYNVGDFSLKLDLFDTSKGDFSDTSHFLTGDFFSGVWDISGDIFGFSGDFLGS